MKVAIVGDGEDLAKEDNLEEALYRCLKEYYWYEDNANIWFELISDQGRHKLTFEQISEIINAGDIRPFLEQV